jgi:hypothetical protein
LLIAPRIDVDRYAKTKQAALVYFISDIDPSGLDLKRTGPSAAGARGWPSVTRRGSDVLVARTEAQAHHAKKGPAEAGPSVREDVPASITEATA